MEILTVLFLLILGGIIGNRIIKNFDLMLYLVGFTIGMLIQFVLVGFM